MAKENYNVKVSLTEKQAAVLAQGKDSAFDNVQAIAQMATAQIADGGVLLRETHRTRIEKVIGDIKDPDQIVDAVEKSRGLCGENRIMSAQLDPIFAGEMDEKARMVGMTTQALVTDLFTTALHMGILCDMSTDRQDIYFSREQADFLRRRFELPDGQAMTGDFLARKLGWKAEEEFENMFEEPAAAGAAK